MDGYKRTDRLNELFREEIALLLQRKVKDPRVHDVTVTAVRTSPELDVAKVYVVVPGDAAARAAALEGLRHAAPFLRHELGRTLRLRRIPELRFEYDDVHERAMRIEQLLREIKASEADEAGERPATDADSTAPPLDEPRR